MINVQHAFKKIVKIKKKGPHQNLKSFYPQHQVKTKRKGPKILHRSNADYSQIIGGYIPPSPQVLAPLVGCQSQKRKMIEEKSTLLHDYVVLPVQELALVKKIL